MRHEIYLFLTWKVTKNKNLGNHLQGQCCMKIVSVVIHIVFWGHLKGENIMKKFWAHCFSTALCVKKNLQVAHYDPWQQQQHGWQQQSHGWQQPSYYHQPSYHQQPHGWHQPSVWPSPTYVKVAPVHHHQVISRWTFRTSLTSTLGIFI